MGQLLKIGILWTAASLLATIGPAAAVSTSSTPPQPWSGQWLVTRDLGAPGISALTDQQARQMIGETIIIKGPYTRFAGDVCRDSSYAVKVQKTADFLLDYNVTLTQMPLAGAEVRTLEISCQQAPFHDLSLLQTGCVVLVWEGRFFEVHRPGAKPESGRCVR